MRLVHRALLGVLATVLLVAIVILILSMSLPGEAGAASMSETPESDVTPSWMVTSSTEKQPVRDVETKIVTSEKRHFVRHSSTEKKKRLKPLTPFTGKSAAHGDHSSSFSASEATSETTLSTPVSTSPSGGCRGLAEERRGALQAVLENSWRGGEREDPAAEQETSRADFESSVRHAIEGLATSLALVRSQVGGLRGGWRELSSTVSDSADRTLSALARLESRVDGCGSERGGVHTTASRSARSFGASTTTPGPRQDALQSRSRDESILGETGTDRPPASVSRLERKPDAALDGGHGPRQQGGRQPPSPDQLRPLLREAADRVVDAVAAEPRAGEQEKAERMTGLHLKADALGDKLAGLSGQMGALRSLVESEAGQRARLASAVDRLQSSVGAVQGQVSSLASALASAAEAAKQQTRAVQSQVDFLAATVPTTTHQLLLTLARAGSELAKALSSILDSPGLSFLGVSSSHAGSRLQERLANMVTIVRLVDGSTHKEGRVEVFHEGRWGTVCDDSFGDGDAAVVCRTLGFHGPARALSQAHFGQGSGVIWLDEVSCSSSDQFLGECSHARWGSHDCEHSEDVGVRCS